MGKCQGRRQVRQTPTIKPTPRFLTKQQRRPHRVGQHEPRRRLQEAGHPIPQAPRDDRPDVVQLVLPKPDDGDELGAGLQRDAGKPLALLQHQVHRPGPAQQRLLRAADGEHDRGAAAAAEEAEAGLLGGVGDADGEEELAHQREAEVDLEGHRVDVDACCLYIHCFVELLNC